MLSDWIKSLPTTDKSLCFPPTLTHLWLFTPRAQGRDLRPLEGWWMRFYLLWKSTWKTGLNWTIPELTKERLQNKLKNSHKTPDTLTRTSGRSWVKQGKVSKVYEVCKNERSSSPKTVAGPETFLLRPSLLWKAMNLRGWSVTPGGLSFKVDL